jgi:hypothetical protein
MIKSRIYMAVVFATAISTLLAAPVRQQSQIKPVARRGTTAVHHDVKAYNATNKTTATITNPTSTNSTATTTVDAGPAPLTTAPPIPMTPMPMKLPSLDPDSIIDPIEFTSRPWDKSSQFSIDDTTPDRHFSRLSENDFADFAEEFGVEVAAIKAVVEIEAGKSHEGFYKPGKPIINFDATMYRKLAPRYGVSLTSAKRKAPEIFLRPNARKYGSYQAAQYARLEAARAIHDASALESAFWGMFQIGGFNWKQCGCSSVEEFVNLMSQSEREQLELFGRMISNGGMLEALQQKQWLRFAMKYNGPSAKARGYHTKMASAYARYKAAEK